MCDHAQNLRSPATTFSQRQGKSKCSPPSSVSSIRKLKLAIPAANLTPRANLYDLGLTSFDAIRLLVAVERAFKIEFQREMLNRESAASIETIAKAVQAIQQTPAVEVREAA